MKTHLKFLGIILYFSSDWKSPNSSLGIYQLLPFVITFLLFLVDLFQAHFIDRIWRHSCYRLIWNCFFLISISESCSRYFFVPSINSWCHLFVYQCLYDDIKWPEAKSYEVIVLRLFLCHFLSGLLMLILDNNQ